MTSIEREKLPNTFISALKIQKEPLSPLVRDRSLAQLIDEKDWNCLPGLYMELKKLPKEKFARVLDIGCGENVAVKELEEKYKNWKTHGLDLSPRRDGYKTETIIGGESSILPYKSNTFDLVFSKYTYSHLPKKIEAIIEALRITKSGGVVLLQTFPDSAYELVENPDIAKKLEANSITLYRNMPCTEKEQIFKKIKISEELHIKGISNKLIHQEDDRSTICIYKKKGDDRRARDLPFKFLGATDNPSVVVKYADHIDSFYQRTPQK